MLAQTDMNCIKLYLIKSGKGVAYLVRLGAVSFPVALPFRLRYHLYMALYSTGIYCKYSALKVKMHLKFVTVNYEEDPWFSQIIF
jgi:hypothetical protein